MTCGQCVRCDAMTNLRSLLCASTGAFTICSLYVLGTVCYITLHSYRHCNGRVEWHGRKTTLKQSWLWLWLKGSWRKLPLQKWRFSPLTWNVGMISLEPNLNHLLLWLAFFQMLFQTRECPKIHKSTATRNSRQAFLIKFWKKLAKKRHKRKRYKKATRKREKKRLWRCAERDLAQKFKGW